MSVSMSSLRIAAIAALCAVSSLSPARAADKLTGAFSTPLKVHHMYSAADGKSHVELFELPSGQGGVAAHSALFSSPTKAVNIFYVPDGFQSDWHNAEDRFLVVMLQGDYILDVDDGREHPVRTGEALYSEDWSGKGHRSLCRAPAGQKVCVLHQTVLGPPDKSQPLRPAP